MNTTNRTLIASGVFLLAAGLLAPLWMSFAMDGMMGNGGQWTGPWHGWMGGMGFAWMAMLGFWLVVAIGFMLLIRAIDLRRRGRDEAPLDIAKRRYAAGEISRDEYERIRRDLEH